jgi:hypothetical protein
VNGSTLKTEKKKSKFGFNFVDLSILAVIVILFLTFITSLFSEKNSEELLLKLCLSAEDAAQLELADFSLSTEDAIYLSDGKTLLGYPDGDYEKGDPFLVVRVTARKEGEDRLVGDLPLSVDQTLDVRCAKLRLYGLTVKEITEVTDND